MPLKSFYIRFPMKRIVYLLFFFVCFAALPAFAQEGFKAGLSFGPAFSQFDGDNLVGYHHVGFRGGVYVRRKMTNGLDLQFEIAYSQKGSRQPVDSNGLYSGPPLTLLRLHYIEIPLLANFRLKKKLRGEAGLALGYLVTGRREFSTGLVEKPVTTFRALDLNYLIGVEYRFTDHWAVNGRWTYSLLPAEKGYNNAVFFSRTRPSYNNVLSLEVRRTF
jgi:hypothetical protein